MMTNKELEIQLDIKRNLITKLEARIHRQKKKIAELSKQAPEWISVTDKLPNANSKVLAIDGDDDTLIVCYDGDKFESGGYRVYVQYWMPIPKQPIK